jgi:hypothetical protein
MLRLYPLNTHHPPKLPSQACFPQYLPNPQQLAYITLPNTATVSPVNPSTPPLPLQHRLCTSLHHQELQIFQLYTLLGNRIILDKRGSVHRNRRFINRNRKWDSLNRFRVRACSRRWLDMLNHHNLRCNNSSYMGVRAGNGEPLRRLSSNILTVNRFSRFLCRIHIRCSNKLGVCECGTLM